MGGQAGQGGGGQTPVKGYTGPQQGPQGLGSALMSLVKAAQSPVEMTAGKQFMKQPSSKGGAAGPSRDPASRGGPENWGPGGRTS